MNFEDAYKSLIQEQNLPALKAEMTKQHIFSAAVIEATEIRTDGEINYLYCPITLCEGYEDTPGMLNSVPVDFGDLLPEWTGYFYFSVLFVAAKEDYLFNKYVSYEATIAHELLHLKQMIRRITTDPTMITRAQKYCFSATKVYDLRHGLRYEVEKILKMEAEAHEQDWDLGVRHLIHSGGENEALAVEYFDKKTFVQHAVTLYVGTVMMNFKAKFPMKTSDIKSIMKGLLVEFGSSIYGRDAFKNFGTLFIAASERAGNSKFAHPMGFMVKAMEHS